MTKNTEFKGCWAAVAVIALSMATEARATVIFSDTFEAYNAGDVDCAALIATSGYGFCRELGANTHPTNPSEIGIAAGVPGSGDALPSGSRVMRVHTNGSVLQSDGGVGLGNAESAAYNNYIPADSWWQVAMYVNNFGGEVSVAGSRPMKLFYPCNAAYPCNTNYFLIETGVGTSYNPFNSSALPVPSNGDMWLVSRDNTLGTVNWAGADPGSESKLGQTDLSERIRPNRWNIIRCHADFANAAAASIDCWIGAKGSPLVHVMSWHGGTPVAGSAFTWTVPEARGHRAMWYPSTIPANAVTGTELYMYFDDFYLATSAADLPNYAAGGDASPAPPRGLRVLP